MNGGVRSHRWTPYTPDALMETALALAREIADNTSAISVALTGSALASRNPRIRLH